ncbi:MAG: ATP-binding cassette domain-containing protein [Candidatus Odinarchaeia archaeon]
MISNEAVIKAENLYKQFGKTIAVNDVSFEVKKGEIFGFLGPNSAGKTTTARILCGVLKPDKGKAEIMSYDIARDSYKAKNLLGVSPQMTLPYIDLTVWQNLMFMGELYDVPKRTRERRGTELLKQFKLYEVKDKPAKSLSGGMIKRLNLCMALINDAPILLLDEPTAGLDVQSRKIIHDIIIKLNRERHVTVFLTTHDLNEANEICDRVCIINKGKIAALDRPQQLRARIRKSQSVIISFNRNTPEEKLKRIPGVTNVMRSGDKIKLYTNDTGELAMNLIEYAKKNGLKIISIETALPTLEDVFLQLTN